MSRYLMVLATVTFVGLAIVYGEVEAMKTGYEIRQLSILKRDLTHRLKDSEFRLASVTSPEKLEERMDAYQVKLASPKTLRIARIGAPESAQGRSTRTPSALTGFLIPTAQADTKR